MSSYTPQRNEHGEIVGMLRRHSDEQLDATHFASVLASTRHAVSKSDAQVLEQLLDTTAAAADAPASQQRPRITRYDIATAVVGLLVCIAAIGAINSFAPDLAPRPLATPIPPTAAPATRTRAPTSAPTLTPTSAPTLTPEPSLTPVPTETVEPIIIVREPECDPSVNPRYTVHVEIPPYGSATGVSCVSLDDAKANADAYAQQVLSHFNVTPTP